MVVDEAAKWLTIRSNEWTDLASYLTETRAGVNSAPELEFIVNSNSNSGIGIELPSVEL